jgi:hypothetical protein
MIRNDELVEVGSEESESLISIAEKDISEYEDTRSEDLILSHCCKEAKLNLQNLDKCCKFLTTLLQLFYKSSDPVNHFEIFS